MHGYTLAQAAGPALASTGTSHFGWILGYTIGIVIVLVVVALVVPILLLARSIGTEAPKINDALTQAVHNTAPLAALRTTIEHATIIIGGLHRGRTRLGG
jgi:MFS family permease